MFGLRGILALVLLYTVLVSEATVHRGCVQCPAEDGNYPHPLREDAFVSCKGGVANFKHCLERTIFSKTMNACIRTANMKPIKTPEFDIKLTSCSKVNRQHRVDTFDSSSTSQSGVCSQTCSSYDGLTSGSDVHSVCKAENGGTCKNPILARGMSTAIELEYLKAHNKRRNEVASGQASGDIVGTLPSAANMVELTLNGELSKVAQAWADTCIMGHDCYDCRRITSETETLVGQNAYWAFNYDTKTPGATAMVDAWFDEINILESTDTISKFDNMAAGHFTQLVWAETAQIGCGWSVMAADSPGGWNSHFVYCNYSPGGNFWHASVYKEGSPASQCPYGGNTNSEFTSLCGPSPKPDPCEER